MTFERTLGPCSHSRFNISAVDSEVRHVVVGLDVSPSHHATGEHIRMALPDALSIEELNQLEIILTKLHVAAANLAGFEGE